MIVKKTNPSRRKLRIDLTGPDGNAFMLLGITKGLCKQNDMSEQWPAICADMQSSDYEHLLSVMEKYFGSIIIMER